MEALPDVEGIDERGVTSEFVYCQTADSRRVTVTLPSTESDSRAQRGWQIGPLNRELSAWRGDSQLSLMYDSVKTLRPGSRRCRDLEG
jgi:hypothetical protein